jgi:hypothetical protein
MASAVRTGAVSARSASFIDLPADLGKITAP